MLEQATQETRIESHQEPRPPRTEPAAYTPRDLDEGEDDYDVPAFIRRR
jgi:hypothetical protein